MKFRSFLVCGRSRVPVEADDHVDAADRAAGGRLRQAGEGDMLARNVEQLATILEKEVMMVTDVGVEIWDARREGNSMYDSGGAPSKKSGSCHLAQDTEAFDGYETRINW